MTDERGISVRVFKVTLSCETVSIIPFSSNLDEVQIPSFVIRKWENAKKKVDSHILRGLDTSLCINHQ